MPVVDYSHALRDLAVEAAQRTGRYLLAERPPGLGVAATKSSPTDVVTEMDHAAERLIVELLRERRPGDGVLGEEGADDAGTSGVRWVIDPIDGTVNYLYNLPGWSVSVAAEVDGEVRAGAVAIPWFGEIFSAVLGEGAYRGSQRIRCNPAPGLPYALVATGFGYAAPQRARQAVAVSEVLPAVRDIRRFGSCAADLCGVACGRFDAYYEEGTQRWDLAAGALIAREAGARVEGFDGAAASAEMTIAAPPGLFEPLHDLLRRCFLG